MSLGDITNKSKTALVKKAKNVSAQCLGKLVTIVDGKARRGRGKGKVVKEKPVRRGTKYEHNVPPSTLSPNKQQVSRCP